MTIITNIKNEFSTTRGYFILCLASISVGLSLSSPLMSLGLFGLLIVWLIDGNILAKIKAFYENKIALLISSIYILTILGLLYTSNFDFALGDVRRKLPLFFLPFYLTGFAPLTKKELDLLLKLFIGGVLVATFWSFFVYLGGLNITIVDKRYLSRFTSHIRFGLEVALAVFFSFYYYRRSSIIRNKLLWVSIMSWLLFSSYIFNLFSGISVFLITSIVLILIVGLSTQNKLKKGLFLTFFSLLIVGLFVFINNSISSFYSNNQVELIKEIGYTKEGNWYRIDDKTKQSQLKENGFFVEKHIADKEFADAWNGRSKINYENLDLKGNEIKFTLRRYITSKGLRKDREAITSLTEKEIKAIESGIPNYNYLSMNYFSVRMHNIIWEYDSYVNQRATSGHSVLMRWEFWKTAVNIIKNNMIIGVGTGDIQDAFDKQYEIDNSKLEEKYRLRTHNQYLTYGVTFGLVGMLWFLICLFYPIVKTKLYKSYLYLAFFTIVLLSMITEDTLETHTGINFFVFFNTLFLLNLKHD